MEWATDLVLQNLARTGITNQTSLQGSLKFLSVSLLYVGLYQAFLSKC